MLAGFAAFSPDVSTAAESGLPPGATATASSTPENKNLPDMGTPVRSGSTSVTPGPSGITAQSRFDGSKVSISPEYSNQTGVSLGVALATMLGDQAGNNLLIRPSQIVQPAVGIIDSYVVTINNLLGGTTLVTILVSRGSVKVDSVVISTSGGDTAAPVTTAATTASVTQTINEAGTGYYLVQLATAAAPSVAAVKASTAFAMTANTPAVVNLTGLTASTAYKYYFVAKDAVNNDQAAVSAGLAITTASLPAGYISQGGLIWSPNNATGTTTWNTANTYCTSTTINGQTGWRLPTKDELVGLCNSTALAGQGGRWAPPGHRFCPALTTTTPSGWTTTWSARSTTRSASS